MVFNVDYDSVKGLRLAIFFIILLICLYLAEGVALYASYGTAGNIGSTLGASTENVAFTTEHGQWIFAGSQGLNEWYWQDYDTGTIYGPAESQDAVMNIIREHGGGTYTGSSSGTTYETIPFTVTNQNGVDLIGGLRFAWSLVTFELIPYPFNIVPVILSMLIMIYIGFFIVSIVSGFVPSWL